MDCITKLVSFPGASAHMCEGSSSYLVFVQYFPKSQPTYGLPASWLFLQVGKGFSARQDRLLSIELLLFVACTLWLRWFGSDV